MIIHRLPGRRTGPPDSVPLTSVDLDWNGGAVAPPATFAVAIDDACLWFVAARATPAVVLPDAAPGAFVPGLWRCDVAELFLGHVDTPTYLEVNLAPNGAWWTCAFIAPRVRHHELDMPIEDVRTGANQPHRLGWRAALGIPLAALPAPLRLDDGTTANVAFVVDAPDRRYVSATPPVPGPPDFHAPALRRPVSIVPAA